MTLAFGLWAALAAAQEPLRWAEDLDEPTCWESAEYPAYGVGIARRGNRAVAAWDYPDTVVERPRFYETRDGLWVANGEQLLRYDFLQDRFTTLWEGSASEELVASAFLGDRWYWVEPEPDASGALTLVQVHLDPDAPRAEMLALDIAAGVRAQPWGPEVMGEGEPAGFNAPPSRFTRVRAEGLEAGDGRLWLLLRFPRSAGVSAAIAALTLSEGRASLGEIWPLDFDFHDWLFLPAGVGTSGEGQPAQVALLDDSVLHLLPLAPCPAGAPCPMRTLDVAEVTAFMYSSRGRSLLVGSESGCITRLPLDAAEPGERWCNADAELPMPGVRLDGGPVQLLAELPDGRLLVSQSPEEWIGEPEADGSLLSTYFLIPPWESGGGWRALPLPISEALRPEGTERSAEPLFTSVYGDAHGRIWSAVRPSGQELYHILRLDLPFQSLPALLGAPVRAQVPFAGGVAALLADGQVRHVLARAPHRGRALASPGLALAVAAAAEGLWGLVERGEQLALVRWAEPGGAPEVIRELPPLPPGAEGMWVDAAGQDVRLGRRDGGGAWRLAERGWAEEPGGGPCLPPLLAPSLLGGERVCFALEDGRPTWRLGERRLVPSSAATWLEWATVDGEWRFGELNGKVGLAVDIASPLAGSAPVYVALSAPGQAEVFHLTDQGIKVLGPGGESRSALIWPRSTQREISLRRCEAAAARGRRVGLVDLFVDGNGTLWLQTYQGESPHQVRHLLGPTLPRIPALRSRLWPFSAGQVTLQTAAQADPRLLVTSSCAPGQVLPVGERLPFRFDPQVTPWRRCEFAATNAFKMWQRQRTARVSSVQGWLAAGVGAALMFLLSGGWVFWRWWTVRSLVQRIAKMAENPFIAGPPVRGKRFYGRERLIAQLMAMLRQDRTYILLADEKRIGKTSLLLRLQELLEAEGEREEGLRPIPVYYSLEVSQQGAAFFRELWKRLEPCARQLGLLDRLTFADPQTEEECFLDLTDLLLALEEGNVPARVVLLMDEFQILAGSGATPAAQDAAQRLRSLTAETFSRHLSWVAAGVKARLRDRPRDEDSDLLLIGPRFTLGFLEEEAARRLIQEPIRSAGYPVRFTPRAQQELLAYSQGHPLVLQAACKTLLTDAALELASSWRVRRVLVGVEEVQRFIRDNPMAHLLARHAGDD